MWLGASILALIRKRWPCFWNKCAVLYHEAYDRDAALHSVLVRIYGFKCVRCGHFEPMGTKVRRALSPTEHAEYLRTLHLPRR